VSDVSVISVLAMVTWLALLVRAAFLVARPQPRGVTTR
jgi:predicted transcriptional regulator